MPAAIRFVLSTISMLIVITIIAIIIVFIKITIITITLPPRILCRSIFFFFHSSFSNSLCRIAIILCHESYKLVSLVMVLVIVMVMVQLVQFFFK